MGRLEPRRRAGIRRGEAAGVALLAAGMLAVWGAYGMLVTPHTEAPGSSALLSLGLVRDRLSCGVLLLGLVGAGWGLKLLASGLISRIGNTWIRETLGLIGLAVGLLAATATAAGYLLLVAAFA